MPVPELSPHHAAALAEAVDAFRDGPTVLAVLAVLFGGSVARGQGRPDSDIDLRVIVNESESARRTAQDDVEVVRGLDHRYAGGHFDAQVALFRWFVAETAKRDDPYLTSYATSRLALYSGRVFPAWNLMLYPFHKWFLTEVEQAPARPAELEWPWRLGPPALEER